MCTKKMFIPLLTLLLMGCNFNASQSKNQTTPPNIIYILADDLGYGDLSCYGQENFSTPNIDELAESGLKFTQHYSGAAVCAPSRSSLITGQHTGHTPIRANRELEGEGQVSLPASSQSIAGLLKESGYVTGAFGKWGLGFIDSEGDPLNHGFDEFFGYNCQRMAHRYYPPYLWHNKEKYPLNGNDWTQTVTYAPDVIQQKTLDFIESNKDTSFFAYVPFVLPHAELISPDDSILKQFLGKFEEKPHPVTAPYTSDYGPNIEPHKYCSQETPYAIFASMVVRLDAYVGQIVSKLEELDIADNTIIMFASDNGPHVEGGADPILFNSSGGLRGTKRDFYEGGIRSPFIVVWPNKIKAGTETDHISAFWDIMPTFADITNNTSDINTDGISFLPTLIGNKQEQHKFLYWESPANAGRQAVRIGDWKGVKYNLRKGGKMELYNLATDIAENKNIANEHPEIVAKMEEIMKMESTPSELFPLY